MAVQSFYISINISEEEKKTIQSVSNLKRYKKSDDLIYKNVLFIDNIIVDESWWHINVGLYDFFHNCEILYEFCQIIESIKPEFTFLLLGEQHKFIFRSLLDFISFLYPKIKKYKDNFEDRYGVLSVYPKRFFQFRRKNKNYYN